MKYFPTQFLKWHCERDWDVATVLYGGMAQCFDTPGRQRFTCHEGRLPWQSWRRLQLYCGDERFTKGMRKKIWLGHVRAIKSKSEQEGQVRSNRIPGRFWMLDGSFYGFFQLRLPQIVPDGRLSRGLWAFTGETKCHEDRPSKAWVALHHATVSIDTRISTTQLPGIFGLVLINAAWGLWNLNWVLKH